MYKVSNFTFINSIQFHVLLCKVFNFVFSPSSSSSSFLFCLSRLVLEAMQHLNDLGFKLALLRILRSVVFTEAHLMDVSISLLFHCYI